MTKHIPECARSFSGLHRWEPDPVDATNKRCFTCGASEPASGSCLVCGHVGRFAVWHMQSLAGVCGACRGAALASRVPPQQEVEPLAEQNIVDRVLWLIRQANLAPNAYVSDAMCALEELHHKLARVPPPQGAPEAASSGICSCEIHQTCEKCRDTDRDIAALQRARETGAK